MNYLGYIEIKFEIILLFMTVLKRIKDIFSMWYLFIDMNK